MYEQPKEEQSELIFAAKMISNEPENKDRSFVIRFSTEDDEIKIWENEMSGFRGGFFYKSPHYRNKGPFDPSIAYLGSEITINLTKFQLIDAPDITFNLMESQPEKYPFSDLNRVCEKLRELKSPEELQNLFKKYDKDNIGRILLSDALKLFKEEFPELNDQEIKTVMRRYRFYNTNRFDYSDLLCTM